MPIPGDGQYLLAHTYDASKPIIANYIHVAQV